MKLETLSAFLKMSSSLWYFAPLGLFPQCQGDTWLPSMASQRSATVYSLSRWPISAFSFLPPLA